MFKALKVLTNKTKKDCCSIQILTVDEKNDEHNENADCCESTTEQPCC